MAVKVGINGFGRIGRVVFRTCLQNSEIQVSAINDPAIDAEYVCYLIKFDSTHGKFNGSVRQTDGGIIVNDQIVKLFHEKLPATVPWQTVGVQYVVEASGMFTCLEKASGHLASESVKRVIVTSPSVDAPMIIIGVNDSKLNPEHKVISCASSTLYCLAPIIKVLEEKFGVNQGFITSIHAMTPSLKPLDGLCLRGKHWRDHRSIHQNIIPATTGACKALGKIIPRVKDKMSGLAFRVPIVNVSVLDISVRLDKNTTLQDIIKHVVKISKSSMKNIIKISSDQAVSSDFIGESHSCIFDTESSMQLNQDFFKIICWYENEYSYARRIIDSIFFSENQFRQHAVLMSNLTFIRPRSSKKQNENKENSLKCNCNSALSTNVLCSTSHETSFKSKPSSRPVILRKPTSSHTTHTVSSSFSHDTKNRNEIFKIWNNNSDLAKRSTNQNRGSVFHSCYTTVPQNTEKSDCTKAQERLANVKREFSKMVNITEDLLKKTYNNKFKFSSLATTSKEDVESGNKELDKINTSTLEESKCISLKHNNALTANSDRDLCDNNKNSIGLTNILVKQINNKQELNINKTENNRIKRNKYTLNVALTPNFYNTENAEKATFLGNETPKENKTISGQEKNKISESNFGFKKQVAKTITTLIDGLSHNMHGYDDFDDENKNLSPLTHSQDYDETEDPVAEVIMNIIESTENEIIEKKTCNTQTSTQRHTMERDVIDKAPQECNVKDFVKYLHSENYNMRIIDEELKKRNIILVSSYTYNTNSQLLKSVSNERFKVEKDERFTVEKDDRAKDMIFKKRTLDSLNKITPEPVVVVPEDTLGCCSPKNTTMSTFTNDDSKKCKQDIYDKLDSTSGTNSNESFEIKEKKSQVLHITDLTNSLEDLARLDKICRIIEISDELSDKLFSSLDKYDCTNLNNNKWSFKDFCEKIKLDDFCNKVFGKDTI